MKNEISTDGSSCEMTWAVLGRGFLRGIYKRECSTELASHLGLIQNLM